MASLAARLRVNAGFPFPALVTGNAPVTISKANGIWQVGLSFNGLTAPAAQSNPDNLLLLTYRVDLGTFYATPISQVGLLPKISLVSALPSAAAVGEGARAFVTDATATTFASVVAGGGTNNVPVYADPPDWRIG